MPRFYLPPDQCGEPELFLTGREARHAIRVLRLDRGALVEVLDGGGRLFACVIEDLVRDRVRLRITHTRIEPPPPCRVTLLQALPKARIIEDIIQKAVELGVTRIVPLLSERVVTKLTVADAAEKAARWQMVAVEAIKQCGAPWLPRVETPVTPTSVLGRGQVCDLPLVASLHPGSRHARTYFETFRAETGHPPRSVCVWVGPEGDFTSSEITAITAAGALPISLGPLVLRCETAATYCLSVISYEIGSLVH